MSKLVAAVFVTLGFLLLAGGNCSSPPTPGPGPSPTPSPTPTPPAPKHYCASDKSKAGKYADREAWLKTIDARVPALAAAIVKNIDSIRAKKVEGDVSRIYPSSQYVFELNGFPDIVFKMAKGAKAEDEGNAPYAQSRVQDVFLANGVIEADGLNCLVTPG